MTFYSYPGEGRVESRNRHVPYRPRYGWGLRIGLAAATVYSLIAAVVALGQRQIYFSRYGLALWQIVGSYYIAGIACGVALAFLYPLTSHRWGAVLLGFLLGTIVYGVIAIAIGGLHPFALVAALIPGILVGGGLGLVEFDRSHHPLK
jgi:hypothetical protein